MRASAVRLDMPQGRGCYARSVRAAIASASRSGDRGGISSIVDAESYCDTAHPIIAPKVVVRQAIAQRLRVDTDRMRRFPQLLHDLDS